jgi:hypothetical protein
LRSPRFPRDVRDGKRLFGLIWAGTNVRLQLGVDNNNEVRLRDIEQAQTEQDCLKKRLRRPRTGNIATSS